MHFIHSLDIWNKGNCPYITNLLTIVKNCIEKHQHNSCGVVGKGCFSTAKLSLVHNIQPRGEEDNPGNAVKYGFQHQKNQARSCQGVLLCSVSTKSRNCKENNRKYLKKIGSYLIL